MRTLKLILPCLLALFLIQSCQKELSQEGGTNLNGNCLNCSYLPICDSSLFRYVDSSAAGVDTLDNLTFILGDSLIGGRNFKSVSAFANFGTGVYMNCDNQDYKVLLPLSALGLNIDSLIQDFLSTIQLPIPIPPGAINVPSTLQTSILKANLATNATWTDSVFNFNIPPILSVFAALEYKIAEKGVSRTLFGTTYPDVIHVTGTMVAGGTFGSLPTGIAIDYYFARNVGLIEMQVSNNGQVDQSLRLYSYVL